MDVIQTGYLYQFLLLHREKLKEKTPEKSSPEESSEVIKSGICM